MKNKYLKKYSCLNKSRRFLSVFIDYLAIMLLFFLARFILLNEVVLEHIRSPEFTAAINSVFSVNFTQAIWFLIIDISIACFVWIFMPVITNGKTIGMILTKSRVINKFGYGMNITTACIRFSPYIISIWLIALSQFIIDGSHIRLWPSFIINDIDFILTSPGLKGMEYVEAVIAACLPIIPFIAAVSLIFNDDTRMFTERWTDTVVIYDGKKIYKSPINVKLISVIEDKKTINTDIIT